MQMQRDNDTPWYTYLCGVCGCLFITGGLIWLIVLTVEFNSLSSELEKANIIGNGAAAVAGAGAAAIGAAAAGARQKPAAQRVQFASDTVVKPNSNAFNYLKNAQAKPQAQAKVADPAARWARSKKQK